MGWYQRGGHGEPMIRPPQRLRCPSPWSTISQAGRTVWQSGPHGDRPLLGAACSAGRWLRYVSQPNDIMTIPTLFNAGDSPYRHESPTPFAPFTVPGGLLYSTCVKDLGGEIANTHPGQTHADCQGCRCGSQSPAIRTCSHVVEATG